MAKKAFKPADVDAYIAGSPEETQATLREIRRVIQSAVPQAEELIRWSQPFYKYHGFLAGFAAFKQHARFGIVGSEIPGEERKLLEENGYTVQERGVKIAYDQEVPAAELTKILHYKARINETGSEQ
jgi:uncharacterized protein